MIHPHAVRRLLCDARLETVLEDGSGNVLGVNRARREPPAWMLRQVRYRDRGCRFPGCGRTAFAEAHHVRWWRFGGTTQLENLILLCSFHHKLVHELGWTIERRPDGAVRWFDPGGTRYRAGPSRGTDSNGPGMDRSHMDERVLLTAAG